MLARTVFQNLFRFKHVYSCLFFLNWRANVSQRKRSRLIYNWFILYLYTSLFNLHYVCTFIRLDLLKIILVVFFFDLWAEYYDDALREVWTNENKSTACAARNLVYFPLVFCTATRHSFAYLKYWQQSAPSKVNPLFSQLLLRNLLVPNYGIFPLCYARGNTSRILVMIVIALPFSTFLWAVHFSTTHNVIGFLRTSVTISPQCRNSRLSYEENLGYFDRRACFNSSALTTSPQNLYHQCIYM